MLDEECISWSGGKRGRERGGIAWPCTHPRGLVTHTEEGERSVTWRVRGTGRFTNWVKRERLSGRLTWDLLLLLLLFFLLLLWEALDGYTLAYHRSGYRRKLSHCTTLCAQYYNIMQIGEEDYWSDYWWQSFVY